MLQRALPHLLQTSSVLRVQEGKKKVVKDELLHPLVITGDQDGGD